MRRAGCMGNLEIRRVASTQPQSRGNHRSPIHSPKVDRPPSGARRLTLNIPPSAAPMPGMSVTTGALTRDQTVRRPIARVSHRLASSDASPSDVDTAHESVTKVSASTRSRAAIAAWSLA